MKKFCIVVLTLLAFIGKVSAQEPRKAIDSLKVLLKTAYNDTVKVNILNSLSDLCISNDKYDSAAYYASQAKLLSDRLNYKSGSSAALRFSGISATCMGEYSKSLEYLFLALKIAESIHNNYLIGKIYNSLGSNFSLQNDFENAINYYYKSLQFYYNPIVYEDIARAHHLEGNYPLAISFYKKALLANITEIEKSYILNDLGDIFEQQNKLDTALVYYFKALEISNKLNHQGSMCDFYGSIGDVLIKMHRDQDAIFYERKSSEIATQLNLKNIRWQSELSLSEIYEHMDNFKLALLHHKIYLSVRDSLFNEENIQQRTKSELNFQFYKQQNIQKAEQDKKDIITLQDKKTQRIIIYSVSIGLFLVFLLAIFIFSGYRQKQKANSIISKQKKIVDERNEEITSSIRYALRIQQAILPTDNFIKSVMPEYQIIFKPKDILSGDFYFIDKIDNKIIWATLDATGHGVPSSLITALGSNILSNIIKGGEIIPSKILDKLNEHINESLHKTGDDSIRDGMDVTMCSLDKNNMILNYAGANNPLWIIRNGEIIEYKSDKMAIGQMYKTASYTNHEIQLQANDCLYSFSDGICDLHSEDNKKFMKKRLRELLLSIQHKSMSEQKVIITETLNNWKGNAEQVDDMLLIGIKV